METAICILVPAVIILLMLVIFCFYGEKHWCCICDETTEDKLIGFDLNHYATMPYVRITSQKIDKADKRICSECLKSLYTQQLKVKDTK